MVTPEQAAGMVIHGFQRLISGRHILACGLGTSQQAMVSVAVITAVLAEIGVISIHPPTMRIPVGVTTHTTAIGIEVIARTAGMVPIVIYIIHMPAMHMHPIEITADLTTAVSGMVTMVDLSMTGVTTTGTRVTANGHIHGNRPIL
ncbi:MAG: hypothetical protein L3J24_03280 [Xanthomonadales bacterium]|nr:hypothetical protein [Xanthomonadales bacterium]